MQQTFGARLRSRREERRISLSVIAEQSKIRVSLLEGLERDDLSQWPRGIFRRSYVRAYAQALGFDPDSIVRQFLDLYPEPIEEGVTSVLAAARGIADASRPRTRLGLLLGSALEALPVRRSTAPAEVSRTPDMSNAGLPVPSAAVGPSADGPRPPLVPEGSSIDSQLGDVGPRGEPPAGEVGGLVEVRRAKVPRDPQVQPESDADSLPALTRLADACGRIASASTADDVAGAVADAAGALGATGLILWVWDTDSDALAAAVAHGYSARVLRELPRVHRSDDTPVAAAFRTADAVVVDGAGGATGAVVVPVISEYGCVGVLALELHAGSERHPLVRVMAAFLAAQLSTLIAPVPSLNAATA